jgi:uncharacterized DUF497 family protein
MTNDDFEWDDEKAAGNLRKHGVSFEEARDVFKDAFGMLELDLTRGHGEERLIFTGVARDRILVVVHTEREDRIRIISARRANKREQRDYYQNQTPQ